MDIKDILNKFATLGLPLLGAALPIPGGAAFGAALASSIGAKDPSAQSILDKVSVDAEALEKAREFEATNRTEIMLATLKHLEVTHAQAVADRDSARQREMAVKDNTNRMLAYSIVGSFLCMVGASLLGYAKVDSALAGTLVGYLSAKAEQVLSYYFGSSAGSARKTELLSQAPPIGEAK